MITHFFDESFRIERQKALGGHRSGFTATATIEAHIQTGSGNHGAQYYGASTAEFVGFSEVGSVALGDHMISLRNGKQYEVMKVNTKDYTFALNVHDELELRQLNPRKNVE